MRQDCPAPLNALRARRAPSRRLLRTLLVIASLLPSTALAADYRTEGATIRLIAEPPDDAGRIRGAVLFELDPGWKTYWLDPGGSGLAPQLDFEGSVGVVPPRLSFPPPKRLMADGEALNGYDAPMAVAFETTGTAYGRLVLSLFAGICRTLCVPVAARMERDLADPLSLKDAMAIDRAFLAVPTVEGAVAGRIEDGTLVVEASLQLQGAQDLFVAGPGGWRFGIPGEAGGTAWRVPIEERPREGTPPAGFEGVFVRGDRAFALTIDLR